MKRIAIVGAGVAGLVAAYRLAGAAEVTLFEAEPVPGGHARTVDVTLDGHTHGVDTAFLSLNTRTYPQLLALFAELGVETVSAPLSFSVQVPGAGLEWSGPHLNALFAQRRNLLRPAFLRMLADVLRFNRLATRLAETGQDQALREPLGSFLERHRFSTAFRDWYLLPVVGSLWNCPTPRMLDFPVATLVRYCYNHGLIDATSRQPWHTVKDGSRTYVQRIVASIQARGARVHTATPVRSVRRLAGPDGRVTVQVTTDHGSTVHDDVILATHADQSLALLADADAQERRILGAFAFHANHAVLHTDASMMPRRRRAWGSWSYECASHVGREEAGACVHYWLNALQPVPFSTPLFVSINPVREPDPARVIDRFSFTHPVFDQAAIDAQPDVARLQGVRRTWFCGAWMGYGFHEDGLKAGQAVALAIARRDALSLHALPRPAAAAARAA